MTRILWIGQSPSGSEAGDQVFDRKTIAACRDLGMDIDVYHPQPTGRLREAAALAAGVLPFQRGRFATAANYRIIAEKSRNADAVICSWEPLDALVRRVDAPCILILHNITSVALPRLFPGSTWASLSARRARAWEQRWYRAGQFAAIGALSRRDLHYLSTLPDAPDLILLPPGMPPCAPLDQVPLFKPELVIRGSYAWKPKRRDLLHFAREYTELGKPFPVLACGLPAYVSALLEPLSVKISTDAIRLGLITDKFEAGHKLKTLAYIAGNQIVLSFAEIAFDFLHIPDHDLFIQKINRTAEMPYIAERLAQMPPTELRHRFQQFKEACAGHFTWAAVAKGLQEVVIRVQSNRSTERSRSAGAKRPRS